MICPFETMLSTVKLPTPTTPRYEIDSSLCCSGNFSTAVDLLSLPYARRRAKNTCHQRPNPVTKPRRLGFRPSEASSSSPRRSAIPPRISTRHPKRARIAAAATALIWARRSRRVPKVGTGSPRSNLRARCWTFCPLCSPWRRRRKEKVPRFRLQGVPRPHPHSLRRQHRQRLELPLPTLSTPRSTPCGWRWMLLVPCFDDGGKAAAAVWLRRSYTRVAGPGRTRR